MKKTNKQKRHIQSDGNVQSKRIKGDSPGLPPSISAFLRNTRLQSILVVMLAFLLYANTLGHQWAQDDTVVITDNMLTKQGLSGIKEIFSSDSFYGYFKIAGKADVVSGGRYRPLTLVMFAVLFEIFGLVPFPFHLLTVVLFAFTCLLLYRTMLLLLRDYRGQGYAEVAAWMATLLFVVHPIHTEAVANIKGCDEIVTLLLSLGALYLSIKAVDTGKMVFRMSAGFSLFLALLAKENAVTFLAVIPLALIFFRGADSTKLIKAGWPLLIAFGVFFMMRMAVLPNLFSKPPAEILNNPYLKWVDGQWIDFTQGEKFATIMYSLGLYIKLLIVPITLTYDYYPRHIGIMEMSDPLVLGSIALYLFLAWYALKNFWNGKRDLLSFGILYYLITLSIVSNLVFPIGTNMGERFMFMPSIGFCLAATALLLSLAQWDQRLGFLKISRSLGLLGVVIVLFSIKTVVRNQAWYDNKSLAFTDVLTSFKSTKVQSLCGMIYCTEGIDEKDPAKKTEMFRKSVEHNSLAIEIDPTYRSALLNRGVAYYHLQLFDEAISDQRRVLAMVPGDPKGLSNLSLALCGKGKFYADEKQDFVTSLKLLNEAFETDNTNEEAIWQLGLVYAKRAEYPEAIRWFTKFTEIRPQDPAAWGGLEWVYALSGDLAKAAECKAKATELNQKSTEKK